MSNSAHENIKSIITKYSEKDFNEADTRHKIIDGILHESLGWPRELVKCESFIDAGFIDYRLKKSNGDDLIFLEAKKKGQYFRLPKNFNNHVLSKHIIISTLLTDTKIKSAIEQVRNYCMEEGCEFAGITNGDVWIFFKTFEKGKNWKSLKAFVIKSINYFDNSFIEATNNFGFSSILDGSLKNLLGSVSRSYREIFYPKDKIPSYDHKVNSNTYARELRPIADKYFGIIDITDKEFMGHCYVNQREYEQAFDNFKSIIRDSLTPYFEEYGIQEFEDNEKGGKFGSRIKKTIREPKKGEVIILFGGKGSGKSTFLKKLLYYNPPEYIANHSQIAIVDLLNTTEDDQSIHATIWNQIIDKLDNDKVLKGSRDQLLTELFFDEYEVAKKQTLFGIKENSKDYNIRLNDLVKVWLSDKKYCSKRLVAYWKRRKRGTIIVIDNTDQFSHHIQDLCFTSAQEIADSLNCLVIVSMREERFHASRMHGTLDAYQNSGFHISSPVTQAVFQKRIDYVLLILSDRLRNEVMYYDKSDQIKVEGLNKLFKIFENEFHKTSYSPLNEFLTACAHGNIRLALELFRDFLKSGYTNVDEMISIQGLWTLKIHQVLKPFMIPYRFFYDEPQSSIPNIYQIRSKSNGSHFTGLRILARLADGIDPNNPFYVSVSELKDYFSETFNMVDDFEKNLDVFLKFDIVEANNRIDYYCEEVDRIKITTYGLYIYKTLSKYFTYLELISTDCGFFNESVANDMVELSKEDFRLFNERKKHDRIIARLSKAERFIEYLKNEEATEIEFYHLKESSFSTTIHKHFQEEQDQVIKSADRN